MSAPIFAIALNNGGHSIVDAEAEEMVSAFRWARVRRHNNRWYASAYIPGNNGSIYLHRLVAAAGPGQMVDHANGDGLDNRWDNLRIATPSQNAANAGLSKRNKSGFKGVFLIQRRWRAFITKDTKSHHLGMFATAELAAEAYDRAALEMFGEFAVLNLPHKITCSDCGTAWAISQRKRERAE